MVFLEQKAETTLRAWIEPWTPLRVPLIFHLRRDPYERGYATSNTYYDWLIDRVFLLVPAQQYVGQFPVDVQGVPAPPEGSDLQLDQVMEKLQSPGGSS